MPLAENNGLVLDYLLPEDATQAAAIFVTAFSTHFEFFRHMIPDTPAAHQAWIECTLAALKDTKHTIALKVTDPTANNKVVAVGRWCTPQQPDETVLPGHEEGRWDALFPGCADTNLAESLFGAFDRNREAFVGGRPHYYMELLSTHPEHTRRGAASMILKHGLKLADQDHMPCYIDSSPKGRPLYEKMGWKLTVEEQFDYGMTYYFGVREPKTAS